MMYSVFCDASRSQVSSNTKQNPSNNYSKYLSAMNIQNLEVPLSLKDFPKFE